MIRPIHPVLFSLTALPLITALVVVTFLTMDDESGVAQYALVMAVGVLALVAIVVFLLAMMPGFESTLEASAFSPFFTGLISNFFG